MEALEALGMESNKAYYQIDEWKKEAAHTGTEEFSYSKYDDFLAAVESGANLPAVIKEYMDHGASKSTLASQITSQYKKQYIALMKTNPAAAENMKAMLLTAYAALGYDRTQKAKDIDKWLKE
jgi:Zn-dependent M32 family carboxypeptidase